jgi:hypothetical protein
MRERAMNLIRAIKRYRIRRLESIIVDLEDLLDHAPDEFSVAVRYDNLQRAYSSLERLKK